MFFYSRNKQDFILEHQLTEELNEYRRRASGTARSTEIANGHDADGASRMHRWNSDLALSRGALVNGDGAVDSDNPAESRRTAEHSHRRNGAVSVNGYHGHVTTAVLESTTRTRDCNPYCEVCRIYRSKLVKHTDRKVGLLNGVGTMMHGMPATVS